MKIGELSKRTGVSIRSLRYYEQKNLIRPSRLDNGYREFEESDIEKVKAVQLFLKIGMNTDEIYHVLACDDFHFTESNGCAHIAVELYSERLINVRKQIQHLQKIEHQLENLVDYWETEQEKETLESIPVMKKYEGK
ncbi:MerR family transcriptional regulator [Gracilibacillus alcaliphilus]|uniref:MerR family transcriptional regulator n=1 Tax=Gracilibacillus alcaliphilus TaxID=1401441 RepID=UPI00195636D8|nr:MerR family transcriptional regulator [Gracilibacillus alcaliphilus]MBM7679728.1 DNA-binding transcriptional MerR regulator [Gracilibacillus alcaliphilus]